MTVAEYPPAREPEETLVASMPSRLARALAELAEQRRTTPAVELRRAVEARVRYANRPAKGVR